jgi:hypothetical protein
LKKRVRERGRKLAYCWTAFASAVAEASVRSLGEGKLSEGQNFSTEGMCKNSSGEREGKKRQKEDALL